MVAKKACGQAQELSPVPSQRERAKEEKKNDSQPLPFPRLNGGGINCRWLHVRVLCALHVACV